MEFKGTRSGTLNFIFILAFNCLVLVLTVKANAK